MQTFQIDILHKANVYWKLFSDIIFQDEKSGKDLKLSNYSFYSFFTLQKNVWKLNIYQNIFFHFFKIQAHFMHCSKIERKKFLEDWLVSFIARSQHDRMQHLVKISIISTARA